MQPRPQTTAIRERLRHLYWLGGGSGAGKSVVARSLAAQYAATVYSTDDVMDVHAARTTPDASPLLAGFIAMDMDERWVNRSPETMLATFHWFGGEGFDLIVEDLLAQTHDRPIIAEGFRLLPHLVEPLLAHPHHAVWLLPTPDFRTAAFESRGSLWAIAGRTSDPERALRNLLARDRMFTDHLRAELKRLGLRAIEVEVGMTEDELAGQVTEAFER